MSDEYPPTPWEHGSTPLARAFKRVDDRQEVLANNEDADQVHTNLTSVKRAMLHGIELEGEPIDPNELDVYATGLSAVYFALLGKVDEDDHDQREAIVRGLVIHSFMVAGLPAPAQFGRDPYRDDTGPRVHEPVVRRLSRTQREQLGTDAVQTVLDLEADHLDRVAPALGALGLTDLADEARQLAARLRLALETEGLADEGQDS